MPLFSTRTPQYKRSKPATEGWKSFKRGLNLLLRPTELSNEEMAQADNILLKGSGVPTGRWGTNLYFNAGNTGSIRGFATYINEGANDLMALTDEGYLQKKNNQSSVVVTGASWPSGSTIRSTQLGGKTIIVSENHPLTIYEGTSLEVFATISPPTGLSATNFSGVTGPNQVSYKVVAIDINGNTTTPSNNFVLENMPFDLTETQSRLQWSAPSAATLGGFEIYRGKAGDELYLAAIGPGATQYTDNGEPTSLTIQAPITNTTGGIKSALVKKYKDRILVVPSDDPNKLMISGRFPNQTKFSWADGGGFIYIDPDSGDDITAIEVQPIADRIVVYKNNSSYLVDLQLVQIGNFSVLDPQYQTVSDYVGCSNQDTVQTVGNDTFYFGRDGMYVTGYEPNFLNIIRTNEVSARVRPYFETLGQLDYTTACALYVDNKYLLSFPRKKEILVYDRERGAFAGIWKLPFGISHMRRYFDSSGTEKWVIGSYEDNKVMTFERSTNSDLGQTIIKTLRTGKNSFGDWTRLYIISFFYTLFREVIGTTTVNILVEDRDGNTSTAESFTITGSEVAGLTGWGIDMWGTAPYGDTNVTEVISGGDEITRWGSLFEQSRLVQIEVVSSATNSNFELLGLKLEAKPQSSGSLSSSQRV